jgi:DNA-binding transcriptional MocR family regulator
MSVGPTTLTGLLGDGWRRPRGSAQALAEGLRALVVDGRLAARTRVPSERALAPELGVSRGTVSRAYDRLRADGYLVSARGAGSWLTLPDGSGPAPLPDAPDAATDLSVAALPAPEPLLSEAAERAVRTLARHAASLGYAGTGLTDLREALAARFAERGLPTTADQIMVTAGAQHALTLLLALLCTPGDRALVDAPAYPRTLSALRAARLRAVAVPLTATGWDAHAWGQAIAGAAPRVALTTPDYHNPTGLTMAPEQRTAIAEACSHAGVVLVADETNSELRLDGAATPAPLAAHGPAVSIGSMSKAAWGGLRLGWIRATPRVIRELAATRADVDMSSPVFEQLLATELLQRWDEVLASRRELVRPRRDALLHALPPQWTVRRPHGGLSAWVRLPAPVATRLAAAAARERIFIAPGPSFSVDGTFEHHLRIPFTLPPDDLTAAVETLASLATRLKAPSDRFETQPVV